MGCPSCGISKTYTNDSTRQSTDTCCSASTSCKTPMVYDPEKIISECIFVEKVYDSRIIRKEIDTVVTSTFNPGFSLTGAVAFDNVTISCSSVGISVLPTIVTINGITPPIGPTPTGPGGVDQIDLSFIDTSECDALGKGTPIIIEQELDVSGTVAIRISGNVLFADGTIRTFNTVLNVLLTPQTITGFAQLCIPSTSAALKPSLAEFCAALCDFILPAGPNSLTILNPTTIQVVGALAICITCEKKVKVPVQLCVLSTGFCKPPEQGGICVEFPKLFPDQVNTPIIDDDCE